MIVIDFGAAVLYPIEFTHSEHFYYPCDKGVDCPSKAGIRQTMVFPIEQSYPVNGEFGQVELKIYDNAATDRDTLYCVEFPAKSIYTHYAKNGTAQLSPVSRSQ